MAGESIKGEADTVNATRTVLLIGRTGNWKSSTGNSILNKKAFKSRTSLCGVTSNCELQHTVLEDGSTLNVIDTPGLFDSSKEEDFAYKEIMKYLYLANQRIDAVLLVLSVRNRLSREEAATLKILQVFFGKKISNYLIVVFTGGDDLGSNVRFEEYLLEHPEYQKICSMCEGKSVLFDNKTKDDCKRTQQMGLLLNLVDSVVAKNAEQPFFDKYFVDVMREPARASEMKKLEPLSGDVDPDDLEFLDPLHKRSNNQQKLLIEMMERKLREAAERAERLGEMLEVEKETRLRMEETADELRLLQAELPNRRIKFNRCPIL